MIKAKCNRLLTSASDFSRTGKEGVLGMSSVLTDKQTAVKILYMPEKVVGSECVFIKGSAWISY